MYLFPLVITALVVLCGAACQTSSTRPSPAVATAGPAEPPPPPTSPEGCQQCNGVWGVHGLAQMESCICRARDAGKRCRDGNECEGDCLVPEGGGETEIVDRGPPPRGFFVGRCAELVTTFGCFARAPDGALKAGPQPLTEPPPTLCVD